LLFSILSLFIALNLPLLILICSSLLYAYQYHHNGLTLKSRPTSLLETQVESASSEYRSVMLVRGVSSPTYRPGASRQYKCPRIDIQITDLNDNSGAESTNAYPTYV
jgi:hypothetical protein